MYFSLRKKDNKARFLKADSYFQFIVLTSKVQTKSAFLLLNNLASQQQAVHG